MARRRKPKSPPAAMAPAADTPPAKKDPGDLDDLLARLGIGPDDWDVLVVGDGSGGTWAMPAGWAAVVVDRASVGRKLIHGGMSHGTAGLAELLPYVHAMAWYDGYRSPARRGEVLRVHVVCDNQQTVLTGNALSGGNKAVADVQANQPFWAALLAYERRGYALTYHWMKRSTVALNSLADGISRGDFRMLRQRESQIPAGLAYEYNPGRMPVPAGGEKGDAA